jgi:hypothetical protein
LGPPSLLIGKWQAAQVDGVKECDPDIEEVQSELLRDGMDQ